MSSPISGAAGAEVRLPPPPPPPAPSAGAPAAAHAARSGPSFSKVLEGLSKQVDRGEGLVRRAVRGASHMDAAGLIALQAGIYRYGEAVELCSKLVDRAGSAVRTTLQGSGG